MRPKLRTVSGLNNIHDEDYLEAALSIYNWIHSNKVEGKDGLYFKVNPGYEEDYSTRAVHGKYGLYSGSAGIGIFFVRLYEITEDKKYLDHAVSVLEELIENVPGKEFYEHKLKTALQSDLKVTGWHTGIYSGPSGAGILALTIYEYIQDKRYIEFAIKLGKDIVEASTETSDGRYLTKDTDVFSDGGYVLYFISLYKVTKDSKYLDLARDYARYIYSTGKKAGSAGAEEIKNANGPSTDSEKKNASKASAGLEGTYYEANDLSRVGLPKGSIFPGFSHGTAGIGYIFAVLYEYDKKNWELEGARQAAAFLESISIELGSGRVVPYLWGGETGEDFKDKFYLGFCHGPAGTSLLFTKLFEVTGEHHYLDITKELASGILEAGAPELNSWGLWNSYCTCCGTPGLIEYFEQLYEITADEKYLTASKRAAARVIADSSEVDGGRCFFGHWDRTDHRNVQTYTGLYTGAAGPGANLLRLYGLLKNKKVTPLWEYSYL